MMFAVLPDTDTLRRIRSVMEGDKARNTHPRSVLGPHNVILKEINSSGPAGLLRRMPLSCMLLTSGDMMDKMWNFALDTIFPIDCLGCKKDGEWICSECAKKIPISPQENCFVCKRVSGGGSTCFDCQKSFPVARVLRFFDYDGPIIKSGIRIAKYSYVKEIFERFSEIAVTHLEPMLNNNDIDPRALIFIPVPLHPRRFRERGFNQAEVIGEYMARACGGTFSDALTRVRATLTQADLDEADRIKNIKHAFECKQGSAVKGQYVVLVDDVATTGNTLAECAKVLRNADARQVWTLVLAKG